MRWCWCRHICTYIPDHLLNKRVVGIHLWWCWCRHIWKYLTTSITRGSLSSTYDDVGAATFGSAWPPPQQGGCLRYTYTVHLFVHMYLTTSITSGLLRYTYSDFGAAMVVSTWPLPKQSCWGPQGGRRWCWCRHICTYVPDDFPD